MYRKPELIIEELKDLNGVFLTAQSLKEEFPDDPLLGFDYDNIVYRQEILAEELKQSLKENGYASIIIHLKQKFHHKVNLNNFIEILKAMMDFTTNIYKDVSKGSSFNYFYTLPVNQSFGIVLLVDKVLSIENYEVDDISDLFDHSSNLLGSITSTDNFREVVENFQYSHQSFHNLKCLFKAFKNYQNNIEIEFNPVLTEKKTVFFERTKSANIYKYLKTHRFIPDEEKTGLFRVVGLSKIKNKIEIMPIDTDDLEKSFTAFFDKSLENQIYQYRINDTINLTLTISTKVDETEFKTNETITVLCLNET